MEQAKQQYFRQKLLAEKEKVEIARDQINEDGLGAPLSDSVGELAAYDQHPGDVGSELFERSKDFALREAEMLKLTAIKEALARMDRGEYGTCKACGVEIPLERLEALPYAEYCRNCQEKREARESPGRPVEEDFLEPPLARITNGPIFDGEDSWQAVARWQENAPLCGAGSYYGTEASGELAEGQEGVADIPYEVGDDGVFYKNYKGTDDESAPSERVDVGIEHKEGPKGC